MNKLNRVLKNINVLNILLLALAIVMFFTLAYPLLSTEIKIDITKVEKEPGSKGGKSVSKNNPAVLDVFVLDADYFLHPSLLTDIKTMSVGPLDLQDLVVKAEETDIVDRIPSGLEYVDVAEKNLFHPERRMPADKKEEPEMVRPDIIYYGSIIALEKKIAYIEDKKNPYTTPGRGKRQTPVTEGTMIGGYKLTEVNPESIVLVRGDDKIVVNLRDQKDRQRAETLGNAKMAIKQISNSRMHHPPPMPSPPVRTSVMIPPKPAKPIINK